MAGGINQVEDVELTIGGRVFHPGRLELDRDAALPLQVHVVEELLLHVPGRHRAGGLQQPVGQGRFAVVDVGNDAEIADPLNGNVGHGQAAGRRARWTAASARILRRAWGRPDRRRGPGPPPWDWPDGLPLPGQGQPGPKVAFLSSKKSDPRPMSTDTAPVDTAPVAADNAAADNSGADNAAAELDPRALTLANVERALDELRPYLMADGGNVEVVEIDGPIVKVRLQGACGSCPSSTMTLKMGIERKLREAIPEVDEVVQVL